MIILPVLQRKKQKKMMGKALQRKKSNKSVKKHMGEEQPVDTQHSVDLAEESFELHDVELELDVDLQDVDLELNYEDVQLDLPDDFQDVAVAEDLQDVDGDEDLQDMDLVAELQDVEELPGQVEEGPEEAVVQGGSPVVQGILKRLRRPSERINKLKISKRVCYKEGGRGRTTSDSNETIMLD